MRTTLLVFILLLFIPSVFAQEQDYKLSQLLGQTLQGPEDFSIAPDGNMYVVDKFNIKVFSPEGKLLKEHFIDDKFAGFAITTDNAGNFYVVRGDEKICKYSKDGKLVMCFGSKGGEPGQFNAPRGIDLDAEENIYIADAGNHRIQKFDKTGNLIQVYGSFGDEIGQLREPTYIKIDANNKLNISERNRFQRFNPDGSPDIMIDDYSPEGIAFDSEGNLFISFTTDYNIRKYNTNGDLLETYLQEGSAEGSIKALHTRLSFDVNGNLFLLENDESSEGNRFQKFTPEMEFLFSFGNAGPNSSSKMNIQDITKFDAAGNFYTSSESMLHLYAKNGQHIKSFGGVADDTVFYYSLRSYALNSQGELLVIADHEKGSVHKFSASGEYISSMLKYPLIPDEPLFFAQNIFIDKADNIYLMKGERFLKYDDAGNFIAEIRLTYDRASNGTIYPIQDIAIDALGMFYVLQHYSIIKFNQNGERISKIDVLNPSRSFQAGHAAIDVDDKGRIYVADRLAIKIFDQSGQLLTHLPDQYTLTGNPSVATLRVTPDGSIIRSAVKDFINFHNIRVYTTGGQIPTVNNVSGTVFVDTNENCLLENEKGLEGIIVEAMPGLYYTKTNKTGDYNLEVGIGSYTIKQILPKVTGKKIEPLCPADAQTQTVNFDSYENTVTNFNFANRVTLSPYLSVSVSSDRRRRCFESITKVRYANTGFAPAENAIVYLQLPKEVELLSADRPYTLLADGTYTFAVGTVAANQSGTITLKDKVTCGDESVRGRTVCTRAWITPSNNAPSTPTATVSITGQCNYDLGMVRFVIKNTGQADMTDPKLFRKYIDGDLSSIEQFRLAAGDSLVLWVPTSGMTVRLEADQPDGNGDNTLASVTVEACRTSATQTGFSTGIVNQMPTDDEEAEVAEECLPIIDSFDPNDKLVTPAGRTVEHYTPTGVALKYKIRFQNTGTDVAYRVVVVDTLSEHLDLSTLQVGAASHANRFEVSGKGRPVLTWTFDNIMLPDSTANEPGSHGYIQFSIKPKADLPEKTLVENFADIFFDYNSPVRTNVTTNRIYDMPPVIKESVRMDLEDILATPGIAAFNPAAGKIGSEITISGKRFSPTAASNKVYLQGKPLTVVSASATELIVRVPAGSATGTLKVVTPDGAASSAETFLVYQPPVISSFSPVEGIVGATVTLQGGQLNPDLIQSIKLGNLACEIISNTGNTLVVKVPNQAVTGKFEIQTKGGEVVSASAYTVWHQPLISSLSKYTDIVGATIGIEGGNFAPTAERNQVRFGQVQAQVVQASSTQLQVKVPPGAGSGHITLNTPGGTASSTHFEVIPGPQFTAMNPAQGTVGTEVEIAGQHFGILGLQDEIRFNGEKALVLEATNDRYKVRVPRGAATGRITITGYGGIAHSQADFVVEELTPEQAIGLYPNPTTGRFTLNFLHADFEVQAVEVYNALGKRVHSLTLASPRPDILEVQLPQAKAGLFVLQIRTDRGTVHKKLTVL